MLGWLLWAPLLSRIAGFAVFEHEFTHALMALAMPLVPRPYAFVMLATIGSTLACHGVIWWLAEEIFRFLVSMCYAGHIDNPIALARHRHR